MPALAASGKLAAMASEGYFIDIGVPDSFARAQQEVPQQRRRDFSAEANRVERLHPPRAPDLFSVAA